MDTLVTFIDFLWLFVQNNWWWFVILWLVFSFANQHATVIDYIQKNAGEHAEEVSAFLDKELVRNVVAMFVLLLIVTAFLRFVVWLFDLM